MPPPDRPDRDLAGLLPLGTGRLDGGPGHLRFLARLLLVVGLLAAVPVAMGVGSVASRHAAELAETEAATRHQVTARLLEDAWTPPSAGYETVPTQARVSWTAPRGVGVQERVVRVPRGAVTGSTVQLWVDQEGRLTDRPLTSGQVRGQGVTAGVGTFLGLVVATVLAYLGCDAAVDRSRARRWAAEWAVVEPVWSRGLR